MADAYDSSLTDPFVRKIRRTDAALAFNLASGEGGSMTTPEVLVAWLRGPLLDALAPKCADGRFVEIPPGTPGSFATTNNLISALTLSQTRRTRTHSVGACKGLFRNYPSQGDTMVDGFPPCSASGVSTAPFGQAYEATGVEPAPDSGFAYETVDDSRAVCVLRGFLGIRDNSNKCAGPSGYLKRIWSASDYRRDILALLDNGWIDRSTLTVNVHMVALNHQTGCMADINIHFASHRTPGQYVVYPQIVTQCRHGSSNFDVRSYDRVVNSWLSITRLVVVIIGACYAARLFYFGVKVAKRVCSYLNVENAADVLLQRSQRLQLTTHYVLDLVLGCWLVAMIAVEFATAHAMANYFAEYKDAVVDAQGLDVQEQYLVTRSALSAAFVQRGASASACQREQMLCTRQDLESALRGLDAARFATMPWSGSRYNLSDIDFRVTTLPFSINGTLRSFPVQLIIANRAVYAFALFFAMLKAVRYLRVFKAFRVRYTALITSISYMARYFLFISHLITAFAVAGTSLFGSDIHFDDSFADLQSAYFHLIQQLCFAQRELDEQLFDYDVRKSSMLGFAFVAMFTFVVVLSGSAIIISIICEYWAISTEQRRSAASEQAELLRIQAFQDELTQLGYCSILASATDGDLQRLASLQEALAEQSEVQAHSAQALEKSAPEERAGERGASENGLVQNKRRRWIHSSTKGWSLERQPLQQLRAGLSSCHLFNTASSTKGEGAAESIAHALEAAGKVPVLGSQAIGDVGTVNSKATRASYLRPSRAVRALGSQVRKVEDSLGYLVSKPGTAAASQGGLSRAVSYLGDNLGQFEDALGNAATQTLGEQATTLIRKTMSSTSIVDELTSDFITLDTDV